MDFDLSWILLGLPVAFVLGWLASRLDLRQLRMENQRAPKAYFKGLNYLLNEQQDKAIDAFIEAVQKDPDTSELHFALGNLFRRRGEYDRAVRVHEHLLSRGDLTRPDRERAQHALALDYLKAGLLDRAEDALRRLEATPFESQARLALLAIYERSRDWPQAAAIAQKMHDAGQGDFSTRQAHYLCEQAVALSAQQQWDAARVLLQQAIDAAPEAPRARMELGQLSYQLGDNALAFATLQSVMQTAPQAFGLVAGLLVKVANASGRQTEAFALLKSHYAQARSLDVLEAIVAMSPAHAAGSAHIDSDFGNSAGEPNAAVQPGHSARDWYVRHLEHEPSLVAAAKWIAGEKLEHEQFHPQVQRALDHAVKPLTRYRCAACGFEAKQHFWQCPGCQAWDSYPARRVEEL